MKVGQKVKVVDFMEEYSTFNEWVKKYASEWLELYRKNHLVKLRNGDVGTIIRIANHTDKRKCDRKLYLIKVNENIYLIGENGIESI